MGSAPETFEMSPITYLPLLLATLLLLTLAQDEEKDCCEKTRVGSVDYTLLPDDQLHSQKELPSQCLNNCIYTIADTLTPKFCFQNGDLPTECLSDRTEPSTASTPTTPTPTTTTTTPTTLPNGILVIGGSASAAQSVEFANPQQESCVLNDLPTELAEGSTVNFVSGRLVACGGIKCEVYQDGSWVHFQNTMAYRQYHSSVTIEDFKTIGDAILLIGGEDGDAKTTELIPGDGSAAQPGPF